MKRTRHYGLRLSDRELHMIDRLALHEGLTKSSMIRQLIYRAAWELKLIEPKPESSVYSEPNEHRPN
jgi:hypothetical protein